VLQRSAIFNSSSPLAYMRHTVPTTLQQLSPFCTSRVRTCLPTLGHNWPHLPITWQQLSHSWPHLATTWLQLAIRWLHLASNCPHLAILDTQLAHLINTWPNLYATGNSSQSWPLLASTCTFLSRNLPRLLYTLLHLAPLASSWPTWASIAATSG